MRLTERMARAEGYCCTLAYVLSWKGLRIRPLAAKIGYSQRAILRLKARAEAGEILCCERDCCQLKCIKPYQLKLPYLRKADSTSS